MGALTAILQNPVVSGLELAGIIAAIIVGYLFYKKGRRVKEPSWAVRTSNLVREYTKKLPNLDILYDGRSIENLSISKILFWNRGGDTIRRSDIAPADLIRIETVGGIKLLDVTLLQSNNSASQFSSALAADGKSANLEFEFLDRGQGAVLQVVHSGTTSEDLKVAGTIMGAGTPRRRSIRFVRYLPLPTPRSFDERIKPSTRLRVLGVMCIISAIAIATFASVILITKPEELEGGTWGWLVAFGVLVVSYLVVGARILWTQKAPRGLDAFEEEI